MWCDGTKRVNLNFDLPECVNLDNYDLIIFPDKSAYERFSESIGDRLCYVCDKERDQNTGQIIAHTIPELPEGCKRIIVIDDLCDGGRTFLNIAKSTDTKLDLFIFHGVFSNNALEKLADVFGKIYVSNSLEAPEEQYERVDADRVEIFNVWRL
jgi:ribose-phosphate pyrophosphokinase